MCVHGKCPNEACYHISRLKTSATLQDRPQAQQMLTNTNQMPSFPMTFSFMSVFGFVLFYFDFLRELEIV